MLILGISNMHFKLVPLQWVILEKLCRAVVPKLFGTKDQFHGRQFFHRLVVVGMVSGWFKCITFTVYYISIIITLPPPQIPGEGKGYPLQYSGLENSMGCIVHGVVKSWTRLSDFHSFTHPTSDHQALGPGRWWLLVAQTVKPLPTMWESRVRRLGREDPLGNEMATHSNTLAWEILWMEEPGRLQSMGSQRVRHD